MSTDGVLKTKLRYDLAKTGAGWEVWEHKTFNMHRGVLIWQPQQPGLAVADLAQAVRQKVKETYRLNWLRGFAFGVVIYLPHYPPDVETIGQYLDIRNTAKGVWQWVIVVEYTAKRAFGVHTWMQGYLSSIHSALLTYYMVQGLQVDSYKRDESLWLHLLMLFGGKTLLGFNAKRLNADQVAPENHPLVRILKPIAIVLGLLVSAFTVLEILSLFF